jgi:hypothetical protein
VYDQIWMKHGCPDNIQIIELKMGIEGSNFLKNFIFAPSTSDNFDGVHLRGPAASRHFTYRAVQAVKTVMPVSGHSSRHSIQSADRPISDRDNRSEGENSRNYHANCPQAQFQQRVYGESKSVSSYAEAVKGKQGYVYSVPTANRFNPLN